MALSSEDIASPGGSNENSLNQLYIWLNRCFAIVWQRFCFNVDLKKNMQEMKLAFKQAAKLKTLKRCSYRTYRHASCWAQNGCLPNWEEEHFMEGFKKISASIDSIEKKLDQVNLNLHSKSFVLSMAFVKRVSREAQSKHLEQDPSVNLLINWFC